MHRHRPFLFAAAALALSGALAHPTLNGILGGFLPPKNWRNPHRGRSKPKTTVAHEKRRALKRRNVLRERARR